MARHLCQRLFIVRKTRKVVEELGQTDILKFESYKNVNLISTLKTFP